MVPLSHSWAVRRAYGPRLSHILSFRAAARSLPCMGLRQPDGRPVALAQWVVSFKPAMRQRPICPVISSRSERSPTRSKPSNAGVISRVRARNDRMREWLSFLPMRPSGVGKPFNGLSTLTCLCGSASYSLSYMAQVPSPARPLGDGTWAVAPRSKNPFLHQQGQQRGNGTFTPLNSRAQ